MTETDLTIPYLSASLPGIGGRLRTMAEHFIVEELPLYEPSGEGQHLYVNLSKVGLTTKDVQLQLERLLNLGNNAVGFAGMKDKFAHTTQTFSIPVPPANPADREVFDHDLVAKIKAELPVTVHWARRHGNKLRRGHLLGNRFRIVVTDLAVSLEMALERAERIADGLRQRGVPNFFGQQRFGIDGGNVQKGLALIRNQQRERNSWLRKFLISSYQSYLCNLYLSRRIKLDAFDCLLEGDVAKKHKTGGMFAVETVDLEQPRYAAQEISFTAPLFGAKMWEAKSVAGELENEIRLASGIDTRDWRRVKVDGTRRFGRILLPDLVIVAKQDAVTSPVSADSDSAHSHQNRGAIEFSFSLPKGSFATVVLREFMKVDMMDIAEIDSDTM